MSYYNACSACIRKVAKEQMEEIHYPKHTLKDFGYTRNGNCPKCGGELWYGTAPCPEGKLGCAVLHHASQCQSCGSHFE